MVFGAVTRAVSLAEGVLPVLQDVPAAKVELELLGIAAQDVIGRIFLLFLAHPFSIQIDGHAKITDLAHSIVIQKDIASSQISVDNLIKGSNYYIIFFL